MLTAKDKAHKIVSVLDLKKGIDIVTLDVRGISSVTDYYIIASGTSIRHANALAKYVRDDLSELGVKIHHKEGQRGSSWVLLDYLNVVVHIFDQSSRTYYDLERVWQDAKKVNLLIDKQ